MKLRDYQQEALESVISLSSSGVNSQLIVLPTGSGKTVVMAAVLKHFGVKALVIAHRKELIEQNKNTIEKFCGVKAGIYASGLKDLSNDIVIGSIQSCYRPGSIERLKRENFKILIIDEAHHSSAKTYRKLTNELGFSGSGKLLLGFTATPSLSNGNTLGEIYENIAYSKQISEMIKKNHLSDVVGRKIRTGISLDAVKINQGDYSLSDLTKMIDASSRNKLIVEKYKLHANNSKSIAFCASISHAKSLSNAFNKNKIESEVIHGKMSDIDRKAVLLNLKNGTISVLTSVGVLIEGFDMPDIKTIIMARPTKSKSLYIQMVGRGLRKAKNKKKCLILDFMDKDHNLKQAISLDIAVPFSKVETDIIEGDVCKLPIKYTTYDLSLTLKELEDKEFNIKGKKFFDNTNESNDNHIETSDEYIKKSISKQNSNNAKIGLKIKLQRGEWSAKAPFGYKNICNPDGSKDIIINKKESAIVLQTYKLYATGNYSLRELSKKIRIEHKIDLYKSNLSNILNNPFYHGTMISKGEEYPHKYETIISKSLFDLIKKIKKQTKPVTNKQTLTASYKKLIYCAHCGCMITAEKQKGHIYYHCTQSKGKHGAKWILEDKITDVFVDKLKNIKM